MQAISHLAADDWLDLLQLSWQDYYSFRAGQIPVSEKRLQNLAEFFGLEMTELISGQIDFRKVAAARAPRKDAIPEKYLAAAHGRMRSTITSVEFLEKNFGWRLKQDMLGRFGMSDPSLMDAFSPVSIQLITEMCDYLHKRQFSSQDFFRMGAHSYEGNRHSLVAKFYSEIPTYRDAFEAFATVLMPVFEQNCTYRFGMRDDTTGIVLSNSNPDVANEMGVKYLGSPHLCNVKAGIWASIVSYFNMSLPTVTHPLCEHRGDGVCKHVFDFSQCLDVSAGLTKASVN